MRFLLLIIAIGAGFWIIKRLLSSRNNTQINNDKPPMKMVRCEHCKVHVPAQQAIQKDGAFFCCEAHSRQHKHKE